MVNITRAFGFWQRFFIRCTDLKDTGATLEAIKHDSEI
jgi:hypothetical protein